MKEVKIEKLDHFGNGLSRIDDKVVFIPKTLPGDVVMVEIVKDNKKYLEGKVVKYLEKQKRNSICPYSDICGGCHIIDLDYSEQLKYKEEKIKELFKKSLGIDIKIDKVISDKNINYRNKITLHVQNKKIGFYSEESHDLVEIDSCIIAKEDINKVIIKLKELVKDFDIKEVVIRSNCEVLLDIKGNISSDVLLNSFVDVEVIYLNDTLIKGKGIITEEILGKKFNILPKSFFQVNKEVCSKIFNEVRCYIKDKSYKNVLDLYCGTGIIGILISDLVDNVTGIEVVSDAVINANSNKELNKVNNINFICDKVENRIDEFSDIDLIIVDPPRRGLDSISINNILKISPKDIIYISCDPNTLVRDLKVLSTDYNIKSISIADMFPNTYHVESVVFLSKKIDVHKMKLNLEPFEMIKSGEKTIELRLYDEKRQQVKEGDQIVFTNTATGETLNVIVTKLHRFDTFDELYKSLPLLKCGYTTKNVDKATYIDMEQYYSVEEQKKYGVVGIELCRLK